MEARYLRSLSKYDEMKNSADIEEGKVNVLIELLTTKHEEVSTKNKNSEDKKIALLNSRFNR